MNSTAKAGLAELLGTFTLVFIGAGAGALASSGNAPTPLTGIGVVGVALAHGIALMVIVYAWGGISGAHVNPAVTLGLMLTGRCGIVRGLLYWGAQIAGASMAAYLLLYLLGPIVPLDNELGQTIGVLTLDNPQKTLIVEAILTAFLMFAVFASGAEGRNGNAAGIAIGLVLTMDILMGANLTGASMNPARTFGPALAKGDFTYLWMYFAGPMGGAAVAAVLYALMFAQPKKKES